MTRIGIFGADGRMGRALVAALPGAPGLALAGVAERPGHDLVGTSLAGVTVVDSAAALAAGCDVLIDFTAPAALAGNLAAAEAAGCALLLGTTGLEPQHQAAIDAAAARIAVLQAANTSLGVNLLVALVRQAAAALGPDWDIEIAELHHRMKVDAPSGTALALGAAAAEGRGVALADVAKRGRDGITGARPAGEIGFAALRGGTAAGDHLVLFAGEGERLEFAHRAEDRSIFARGALKAAAWLAGKPAGRYAMADVLGLAR
jgi:4-hydroxy-tetrahydrodipicolinate reductase